MPGSAAQSIVGPKGGPPAPRYQERFALQRQVSRFGDKGDAGLVGTFSVVDQRILYLTQQQGKASIHSGINQRDTNRVAEGCAVGRERHRQAASRRVCGVKVDPVVHKSLDRLRNLRR